MNVISNISDSSERYARCIQTSKRVRWDIDKDVIRGRNFDTAHKFLPDGLSLADAFTTLSADEKRYVSQIQGRTYANIFGLVERFINAKVLELSEDHWFGDQVALEALVRFSDEELKHQALFRLVDAMIGDVLPAGYRFDVDHNAVAHAVLGKSTWAVLARASVAYFEITLNPIGRTSNEMGIKGSEISHTKGESASSPHGGPRPPCPIGSNFPRTRLLSGTASKSIAKCSVNTSTTLRSRTARKASSRAASSCCKPEVSASRKSSLRSPPTHEHAATFLIPTMA